MNGEWTGSPPKACDICHAPIVTEFFDARTRYGSWANMCYDCWLEYAGKLGTGHGQHYAQQMPSNRWLKVEG